MSSLLLRTAWGLGPLSACHLRRDRIEISWPVPRATKSARWPARQEIENDGPMSVGRDEEIEDGDAVADGVDDEHQLSYVTSKHSVGPPGGPLRAERP